MNEIVGREPKPLCGITTRDTEFGDIFSDTLTWQLVSVSLILCKPKI